jgi:hypothetical protein
MASTTVSGERDGTDAGADAETDAGADEGVATAATAPLGRGQRARRTPGWFFGAVGRSVVSDFRVFFSKPIEVVREKKLRAIPGTLVCVALIMFFAIIQHNDTGLAFMKAVAGIHQDEHFWEVVVQIPLSMFAPAPDLPAWGALLQVFIAFGLAECWLGWRRTIGVAVITSGLTSLAARVMVFIGLQFNIGTPWQDAFQLDTGPSVAVVSLLVYLSLKLRTYWIVAATAISMGGEAAVLPNLAGREHLVAISLGFLTYLVLDKLTPWVRAGRRGSKRRPAGPDARP